MFIFAFVCGSAHAHGAEVLVVEQWAVSDLPYVQYRNLITAAGFIVPLAATVGNLPCAPDSGTAANHPARLMLKDGRPRAMNARP
jgi:hypothetical protein